MGLTLDPIKEEGLVIRTVNNVIAFSGLINCERPDRFLKPFFEKIHRQILLRKIKGVVIDIRELSFINSSSIKLIVAWIMKLDEISPEQQYSIKFICDTNAPWQETSIKSLLIFNNTLISYIKKPCEKKADSLFPKSIKCPICRKGLRAKRSGRFRCPICKSTIIIGVNGEVFSG